MYIDDPTRLRTMLDECRRIMETTDGRTRLEMERDELLAPALISRVERLGRAAARVSAEVQRRHPGVDWTCYEDLGTRLLEQYDRVDHDEIWEVATGKVPRLALNVEVILTEVLQTESEANQSTRNVEHHFDPRSLPMPQEAIAELCHRHHVRRLSVFGSYARGEQKPESDIDLLVEFEPGRTPGLMTIVGMQYEMEGIVGAGVDLVLPAELSEYIRGRVLGEARAIYGG